MAVDAIGTRRFAGRRAFLRLLATWLIAAGALLVLAELLGGFEIERTRGALEMAAVVGLVNASAWPLLIQFALPVTMLTLGLSVLALNGLVVWASSHAVPGVDVASPLTGVWIALGMTVINTAATSLLAIDDDDFYYRNVIRRQARRRGDAERSDVPAVVFLEIDGLAHDVLLRAVQDGNANTIGRWLREGTHRLAAWDCEWTSQTASAQLGLLHGTNGDIPAFRWWDKREGRQVASSSPRDVMAIEERVSNGRGLLHAGGASRANMFSGDAPHSLLTISTVLRRREGLGRDYYAYFANPYSFVRTLMLFAWEVVTEVWQASQQRRNDIRPRVGRPVFPYAFVRAFMTVVQRDLQVSAVIADIYAGRPVVYSTFSGYDEMAHHAGIERQETLTVLRKLDRQFARIELAAREAPRPVQFVVLSDHGQTQGATFRQRYGETLAELVERACAAHDVETGAQGDEGWMYLGAMATEVAHGTGALARGVERASRKRQVDEQVLVGPERRARREARPDLPEVVVIASGCLGLVSFPREPGRQTLEAIDGRYPALLPALRTHRGIGFLLVRSQLHGAVVLGASGTHFLDEGRVEGEDPLAPFGPHAARHVRRIDSFETCADVMVNSAYWPETEEVAAFEELVGSHGGLGGPQGRAFVLYPHGWERPNGALVGAEALHTQLRRWLATLGHEEYRDG